MPQRSSTRLAASVAVLGGLALLIASWILLESSAAEEPRERSVPGESSTQVAVVLPSPGDAEVPRPIESTETPMPIETAPATPRPSSSPDFTSRATRTLEVVVLDSEGRVVRDALVEVFGAQRRPDDAQVIQRLIETGVIKAGDRPLQQSLDAVARTMLNSTEYDPTWAVPISTGSTDASGTAELGLPDEECLVVASEPQLGCSGVLTIDSTEKAPAQLSLTLSPREKLSGRVLDRWGQPAFGARVTFSRWDYAPEGRPRSRIPRSIVVDYDGRFEIEVDTVSILSVRGERGGEKTPRKNEWVRPGSPSTVSLRFPGGYAVTGVVLSPRGVGWAGANVAPTRNGFSAQDAVTDGEGRFRLELAQPGPIGLIAEAPGVIQQEPVTVHVSDAVPFVDVVLQLIEPTTISGRVQFDDGTPVPRVVLEAHPSDKILRSPVGSAAHVAAISKYLDFSVELLDLTHADAEGRFTFRRIHPSHLMDIACRSDGTRARDVRVEQVSPGTQDVVVTLARVAPDAGTLRGRVMDARTGTPIVRFEVTCSRWYGTLPSRLAGSGPRLSIEDAMGRFEFTDLVPEREMGLTVEAVDYPKQSFGPFKAVEGSDVEVLLARAASLTVVVTDLDGASQPGASVQLMAGAKSSISALIASIESRRTDMSGSANFAGLLPGEYTVEALFGRRRSPRTKIVVEPGYDAAAQLVVSDVPESANLEVTVLRVDGIPWSEVSVKAVLAKELGSDAGLESVHFGATDAAGRVHLSGLAPGTYMVRAEGLFERIPPGRITLGAHESGRLTMQPAE